MKVKCQFLKKSYFQSTIVEWNKLNSNIRNSTTLNIFNSKILKFIRSNANSFFGCHNLVGVKLVYARHLKLSHRCKQNFQQIFQENLNPFCICGKEDETTSHFLLSCPNYSDGRSTLLSKTKNINLNILEKTNSRITQFLQYEDKDFIASSN